MASAIRLEYLIVALGTFHSRVFAAYQEVSDTECNCYVTNGSTADYFTTHHFYDFRSLSQYAKVPSLITDPVESTNAVETSDYFLSDHWSHSWGLQQWNNSQSLGTEDSEASVLMVNSLNNVYIEKNTDQSPSSDTFLTLRTAKLEDFQSAAEFESINETYHFLSVRMYARTIGGPGAITAMFTYRGSDDPTGVQEADLEIRTLDPPEFIQYTNQPSFSATGSAVAASTRNASVPVGWDEWAVHRLDWSPTNSIWFVDGQEVSRISFQTPRDPSLVIFNSWSDGSFWSGNMSVGDEAYLQIQWIDMIYNTTGTSKTTDPAKRQTSGMLNNLIRRDDDGCSNICSIDDTGKIGTAVLIQSSAVSLRLQGYTGSFADLVFLLPIITAVIILMAK